MKDLVRIMMVIGRLWWSSLFFLEVELKVKGYDGIYFCLVLVYSWLLYLWCGSWWVVF